MVTSSQLKAIYEARASKRWLVRNLLGVVYFSVLLFFAAKAVAADMARGVNATALLAAVFLFGFLGYLLVLSCWSLWLWTHSVKRVSLNGGELMVERVLGHWRGPLSEVRLREGARPPGYKWARYRLELTDGRGIGEIVMHWPGEEQEKSIEQLKEILCKYGPAEEEGLTAENRGVALGVGRVLSGVLARQPWFGKLMFVLWLVASYGGLVVAGARWAQLGLVSLLSLALVLAEVPYVVAAVAALQLGKAKGRGLESALKVLQVGWGCFVVSVVWGWLESSEHAWLALFLAFVYAGVTVLEWAAPGSVFASSVRTGRNPPGGARTQS